MTLLSEIEILDDIFDTLMPNCDDCENERQLSDSETDELHQICLHLIDEFMSDNPTCISEPDFMDNLFDEIIELVNVQLCVNSVFYFFNFIEKNKITDEIDDVVNHSLDHYFNYIVPPRSFESSFIHTKMDNLSIEKIKDILDHLTYVDKNQPQQGTGEWHKVRSNMITASNAYKIFESECQQNQIICDKCIYKGDESNDITTGEKSPSLEWGVKYEPVSVQLYEKEYNTKIGQFMQNT